MKESYVTWLRERIGHQKVFLTFATVIVRDEFGGILLQRRTDFDFYGLPGGVLELDENFEECARRELQEETGLEVGELRFIGVYTDPRYDLVYPNGDQVQQFTISFEGQLSGGLMAVDGVETYEQAFYDPQAILNLDLPLWYRDMIADSKQEAGPTFRQPFKKEVTLDQIAGVRSSIGQALYSGVGAGAIIVRDDGRILMLQHAGESFWRPPAGFSDIGENAAFTAIREVKEETGYQIWPERIITVHATPKLNVTYPNGDQIRMVGIIFRARVTGGYPKVDNIEILQMAWMTRDDAVEHVDPARKWFFLKVFEHIDEGCFVC